MWQALAVLGVVGVPGLHAVKPAGEGRRLRHLIRIVGMVQLKAAPLQEVNLQRQNHRTVVRPVTMVEPH